MHPLADIRKLYHPKQPTVALWQNKVSYTERLPHENLQPFIYCYWELKTNEVLKEPFTYRVVADGCIDIFFELTNPAENYVMGFCRKYTEFPLENSFHYAGIRFLPAAFPLLFKINAKTLSNKYTPLGDVVPRISNYINAHIQSLPETGALKNIFDNCFLDHLSTIKVQGDNRFYEAVELILRNGGTLNVEKEINTGISPRQLRRFFEYYIGDTAKTFARVVRFQNILHAKPSSQSLRQNKLFFDAGYYDQAHFIKEFKTFYGVTPSRAFGR